MVDRQKASGLQPTWLGLTPTSTLSVTAKTSDCKQVLVYRWQRTSIPGCRRSLMPLNSVRSTICAPNPPECDSCCLTVVNSHLGFCRCLDHVTPTSTSRALWLMPRRAGGDSWSLVTVLTHGASCIVHLPIVMDALCLCTPHLGFPKTMPDTFGTESMRVAIERQRKNIERSVTNEPAGI